MKPNLYFNGLNEIRAFAALSVVWHHIEIYKFDLKIPSLLDFNFLSPIFFNLGKNGVLTFFVLSGFLITYLLLEEKQTTQKISVKNFYVRRALRIWPLYFLLLLLSFIAIPIIYLNFPSFFKGQDTFNFLILNLQYESNLVLCIFFLSNIAMYLFGPVVGFSQTWSVSLEEQFYLLWPWIIKLFNKILFPVLIFIIIGNNVFQWLILKSNYFVSHPLLTAIASNFHIHYMAMGGAMVYLFKNEKIKPFFASKTYFYLTLLLLIFQLNYSVSDFVFSFNIGLLILFSITQKVSFGVFNFLGKISYGIYMFHPLVMYFTFSFASYLGIHNLLALNVFVYPIIVGITILISHFSYQYLELYFLKFKDRFSNIKTSV